MALLLALTIPVQTGDLRRPRPEDVPAGSIATRLFEPRLTGGFAYAPLAVPTRGGHERSRSPELMIAMATAERIARANPSPANLRAWGRALLRSGDVDEAIAIFNRATSTDQSSAEGKSDLGAAYLVRGQMSGRLEDNVRGLDAALGAVRRARTLPEAHFNVALALGANQLNEAATREWHAYEAIDARSGWGAEARQNAAARPPPRDEWPALRARLRQTDSPTAPGDITHAVAIFPQDVRELVENELLPSWAGATKAGDRATATKCLSRSLDLATALAQSNDRMLIDIVGSVQRRKDDPRSARALVAGLIVFGQARERLVSQDFEPAIRGFERASGELSAAGNPLARWALTHLAYAEYQQHRSANAIRVIRPIVEYARAHSYDALLGRALWIHALAARDEGAYDRALQLSEQAMAAFERSGERAQAGAVASTVADLARIIGYRQRSWQLLSRGLETLDVENSVLRRYLCYYNASLFARKDGLFEAALAFQNEALREAMTRRRSVAQAYTQRAAILAQLGETADALQDLERGREALSLDSETIREYLSAELQTVHASVVLERDPTRARELLEPTIGFFERTAPEVVPEIRFALGRAALALGQTAPAFEQFSNGIEYFERERRRIGDEALRVAFFGTSADLYREMVRLKLDAGLPEEAFAFSERSRGRELVDAASPGKTAGGPRSAPPFEHIRSLLGSGAAFLEFFLLDREMVSWLVTPSGMTWHRASIAPREVERLVDALRQVDAVSGAPDAAVALYRTLLEPFRDALTNTRTIVISADGVLHRVPFAALIDPRTRRRLLDDVAVTYAPSAAWWIEAAGRTPSQATPTTVLAIGNPRNDDAAELPPLPSAEREARAIAALYPRSTVLTSAAATRQQFLARARQADVVHFAGHAVANLEFPDLSSLLLSPSGDDDGRVRSADIAGTPWRQTRLVVLAACGTADGALTFGEGVMHLARPFLAAGVSAVVATLWDIEDRGTSRLLMRFHSNLMSGLDAAQALRHAQLAMLRSSDPADRQVAQWAPFVIIGAAEHSNATIEGRR